MIRFALLIGAAALLAAPAHAQHDQPAPDDHRDVTITLPDGSSQTVTVGPEAPVRLFLRDGDVVVERPPRRTASEIYAFSGSGFDRGVIPSDIMDLRLDSLLATLPERVRDGVERMNLPRIHFERYVSTDLRRQAADAERTTRRLAVDLRRAEREGDAAEASRLRGELRRALEEAFELNQDLRRERAAGMTEHEARLAEERRDLEREIATREANRSEIIERRQRELVGEPSELDW